MGPSTPFKVVIITIFVLPGIACSGPSTYTSAARTIVVGPNSGVADPPGGIIDRDEYEHSPSYPPG